MNSTKIILPATLMASALLTAGQVLAQERNVVVEQRAEERRQLKEMEEEEFAQRMREAEERLAEAAEQVAELSTRRLEAWRGSPQYEWITSSKPRIGVIIETDETGGPVEGVEVLNITPGSAAEDAGLRSGDVLTSVNGESLTANSNKQANGILLEFMQGVEAGDVLDIEYLRDGKVGSVELEPRPADPMAFAWSGKDGQFVMPDPPAAPFAPDAVREFQFAFGGWHGAWGDMEVVELTEGLGRYFGTDKGLLVISAPKSSEFKLQDGDVIQSIDGREPGSVGHCMRILGSYQPGETLKLRIMRDKREQTLEIELPDKRTGNLLLPHVPAAPVVQPAPVPAVAPIAEPVPHPEPLHEDHT